MTASRRAALEVLRSVRRGGLADRALLTVLDDVPVRDRGWTQELTYGTLRLRARLDHALAPLSKRPLDRLDADVLDVLRLGAYQLLEMHSVPPYAAVSQSVELVRAARRPNAAGFVNGVLQSLRRAGGPAGYPRFESDPAGYLSTWGSHPRWLVDRWLDRRGADETRALVAANNERPVLYLRPVGAGAADAVERLVAAGIDAAAVPGAPDAVALDAGADLRAALAAVPAIVQDPAAGLVVRAAQAPPDGLVADLCAAPGGKAIGMAAAWPERAPPRTVLAAELSAGRLHLLRESLGRLALERVVPVVADARTPPLVPVDLVLVDAPCTGTGTLRRHPDGRWRIGPADLASLVRLQQELLDSAAAVVRPGGVLVYSTCSLEPEENEAQVESFLDRNPEFAMEPVSGVDPSFVTGGCLVVLPQRHGFDGAFAARLRRKAA